MPQLMALLGTAGAAAGAGAGAAGAAGAGAGAAGAGAAGAAGAGAAGAAGASGLTLASGPVSAGTGASLMGGTAGAAGAAPSVAGTAAAAAPMGTPAWFANMAATKTGAASPVLKGLFKFDEAVKSGAIGQSGVTAVDAKDGGESGLLEVLLKKQLTAEAPELPPSPQLAPPPQRVTDRARDIDIDALLARVLMGG